MRVCRSCQTVNGDSSQVCRVCGEHIGEQLCLAPEVPVPRPIPDVLARRNRRYLFLLLLIPLLLCSALWFWLAAVPGMQHQLTDARRKQLAANQQTITKALAACLGDTGGVPTRDLNVLRQYGVMPGQLTPGARPSRWKGPYLPAGQPFPANPFRPHDGVAGWEYQVRGTAGTVTPLL